MSIVFCGYEVEGWASLAGKVKQDYTKLSFSTVMNVFNKIRPT